MKPIDYVLILALALVVLVGCAHVQESQLESVPSSGDNSEAPPSRRGPDRASQLALGMLKLEDTESAVTAAQAAELLPLWRMIASGSLTSDTETNAVLKQIEGLMNGPQLAAINVMELENGDVQAWMQEQGLAMPASSGGQGSMGGQGGPGALQNLSEEDRAKMREEFQNMTAQERATRMAEMGIERPEGGAGAGPGGMRQPNALFGYLVQFLAERAAG
jgi:hypothetical protein